MSVSAIHDLVRIGRCTPAQGALLLEFRRGLAWARLPWWRKAWRVAVRPVLG